MNLYRGMGQKTDVRIIKLEYIFKSVYDLNEVSNAYYKVNLQGTQLTCQWGDFSPFLTEFSSLFHLWEDLLFLGQTFSVELLDSSGR